MRVDQYDGDGSGGGGVRLIEHRQGKDKARLPEPRGIQFDGLVGAEISQQNYSRLLKPFQKLITRKIDPSSATSGKQGIASHRLKPSAVKVKNAAPLQTVPNCTFELILTC